MQISKPYVYKDEDKVQFTVTLTHDEYVVLTLDTNYVSKMFKEYNLHLADLTKKFLEYFKANKGKIDEATKKRNEQM